MAAERVAWFRGEIVPESQVLISFRDAAAVRGEGVYDTERTFAGRIFRLDDHLDRLWRSMAYLGIEPPMPRDELAAITEKVARRNCQIVGDDIWVTQRVSRGVPREAGGDGRPTLIVESLPIPFAARAPGYRDGVRVVTSTLRRTPPWALSPQAKTTNLLNLSLGAQEVRAIDPGAWPMLLDEHGNLAEGAGANIFVVRDGRVSTPLARYVLPGITRGVLFELAADAGIPMEEREIDLYEAYTSDEAFVTSTSLCVCPVASINGRPLGAGARGPVPGPVTARLQDAFRELVGVDFVAQYLRHLT